ncbi:SDR family NAD(P)-dependent oxidoreductase [Streptomyces sp. A5-4]|uniref:SDR family NAD(P)-dependent oxidoreductase n=1 Tax=Streptomyces sp. A5-4 TaxID=3384771 RepID=UPI003DAA3826
MSFVDLIVETIERCPDVVAVRDSKRALTFRQLGGLSAALAVSIQDTAGSYEPVVIDVPRSVGMVVASLAVLRSGRGCVPVDRTQPTRRTETILANTGARYVIREAEPADGSALQFDVTPLPAAGHRSNDRADELAYVLHTTGSTGEPKGVAMGRGPLSGLVDWHVRTEGSSTAPHTAQFAAATFDVAWQEIFTSLALGGTLHIVPDDVRRDPARLLDHFADVGITRVFLPTAILQAVANRGRSRPRLTALQHVFVAGSQLRITPEIRAWFAHLGSARLHNHYGPAETHVVTSHTLGQNASQWPDLPPIGQPLPHVSVRIADADSTNPRAEEADESGEAGELLLGGDCLSYGYRNRPELTAEHFIERDGRRWYRTGDLARHHDGELWYLGRIDRQVKIDGHRVEPGEVEVLLARHPDVSDVHVAVSNDGQGRPRLVAYVVSESIPTVPPPEDDRPTSGQGGQSGQVLGVREADPPWRGFLAPLLSGPSVPSLWIRVDTIPLNAHGKVDAARLPDVARDRPSLSVTYSAPRTSSERLIAGIWETQLDVVGIGRDDNFFDLGGSSLLAAAVVGDISAALGIEFPLVEAYAHPTVRTLAQHLDSRDLPVTAPVRRRVRRPTGDGADMPVAIVGLACRFPDASTPAGFWSNLVTGRESITRHGDGPDERGRTRAAGILRDIELFDAGFFGMSGEQARQLDPQHRLFLECCAEALEDAACVPRPDLSVGVYGGSGPSTYLLNNLLPGQGVRSLTSSVDDFSLLMANDKEFMAGRASYALDLRGPSLNVNAACATSLYALHAAIQALRSGTCDVALAGAASISVPQMFGYLYQESMPFSPDGHCRVFDRDCAGTVFGNGVGVIALKPLDAALAAGDDIYAVVRGSGISNDGAQKVGMTAPSVAGQERAIRMALDAAAIAPSTIRYVEAHGTATPVGDAIEIEALRRAYGPLPVSSCGIGSVKGNLGHLGWASGMAGLLKAVLMLRHGQVPPTLHFQQPNPELSLGNSPFTVVDRLSPLPTEDGVTRLGVSAFGIGGFNAHVILEQAPERTARDEEQRRWYVLPFSARSDAARGRVLEAWRDDALNSVAVPDTARTLGTGRRHHAWRTAAVVAADEAIADGLSRVGGDHSASPYPGTGSVVGLFAGHGVERRGTGQELYDTEPFFRTVLDSFDTVTKAELSTTVSSLLYAPDNQDLPIDDPVEVHALTFAVQLALFRLMESKGVRFDVLLGHSMGQYVAACAAGVFSAEEGMYVAIERGRAIQDTAADGTMMTVVADAATVMRLIEATDSQVDIAVVNSDRNTVVSSLAEDLDRFGAAAASAGLEVRSLGSLRAGHSRWMRPAADRLLHAFGRISLNPATRTVICNTTGDIAGDDIATPAYWARHLCETVQFGPGLARAGELGAGSFFELSGSSGLLSLAHTVLPDHPGPFVPVVRARHDASRTLAQALASAYEAGLDLDWDAVNGDGGRPAHLPTYPFERRRHWTGPSAVWSGDYGVEDAGRAPIHEVRWLPHPLPDSRPPLAAGQVVAVGPDGPWSATVRAALSAENDFSEGRDIVVLFEEDDLDSGVDPVEALRPCITRVLDVVRGAISDPVGDPPRLWLVTRGSQRVSADDRVAPLNRAVWGLGRVVALEQPQLRTVLVDLPAASAAADLDMLRSCLASGTAERELAIRQGTLLTARLAAAAPQDHPPAMLRADRTYLIVGGLTGFGLWTAQVLANSGARHLLLVGRRPPGERAEERIAELRAAGVSVETESVDVCDEDAVDGLFADRRATRPIGGIVHSAGILDDSLVDKASWTTVAPVLTAKVRGAWNLHRSALRHQAPLSFFAMYSSATAVHGNYGQAAYAAANAFLDGLAQLRSAIGLPGVSFNWGVLKNAGHVSDDAELMTALRQRGLGTVDAGVAEAVLRRHLCADTAEVLVLPNDWEVFLDAHDLNDASFYAELSATASPVRAPRPETSLRAQLDGAPLTERTELLARAIAAMIERYIDLPTVLGPDDPIADLGLDSLSMIQLRNTLQSALQMPLPPRLLLTHPTIAGITESLLTRLDDLSTEESPEIRPALSLEQRRWLSLTRGAGYGLRVVPAIFHDRLDRAALRVALHTVVDRHELLRQYYPEANSITVLSADEVLPPEDDLFRDLATMDEEDCAEAVAGELRQLREEIPDPVEHPSWRVRCLNLPDDRFMVAVAGQHLEFDGSGLSVFVGELRQVYREVRDGGAVPDLGRTVQYATYTRAQADYLADSIDRERPYFAGLFAGVPGRTQLPGADQGGTTEAHPSLRYTPGEPLANMDDIRGVAKELEVTPFSVVLSTYAALMAEVVGAPAVCVSMIRSSRFDERYAGTIGPFTMPFPVPIHVQGWGARELVQQVDDTLATLSTHPQYPATDLLTTARAFTGLPLDTYFSDVGINFTSYRREEQTGTPRVDLIEVLGEVEHPLLRRYDFGSLRRIPGLHLVVAEQGPDLVVNYWYHAHRFAEATVATWADRHRALMASLLAADTRESINVAVD